jgi:hypothetical protein
MSTESLIEYEEVIAKRATQLLSGIADLELVDLAAWISYFASVQIIFRIQVVHYIIRFDFMGDMA